MKKTIFIITFMTYCFVFSQSSKSVYKQYDKIVGLNNTPLSYGSIFVEKFKKINGDHNYYLSNNFLDGNLSYRGQKYYNIDIKYDLVDDAIITKISTATKNYAILLENEFVDYFNIKDHVFIYTSKMGFLEQKFIGEKLAFFKKHIKKPQKKLDQDFLHYSFEEKTNYFFRYNTTFYNLSSKKDIIKILPAYKKTINSFYKNQRNLRNKNKEDFLIKLIKTVNEEILKE